MDVMYQNGWKMIDILIHAENIFYILKKKTIWKPWKLITQYLCEYFFNK
jgi:hypothetical protein